MTPDDWLPIAPLAGDRLTLEPLRLDHAEQMQPVLADPLLHTFTGGEPAGDAGALRDRYSRQVVGHSTDGSERWLNWVVRRRDDEQPVGYVQATVSRRAGSSTADVAWVVGTAHQGRGYAQEAAALMVAWLRANGVDEVAAYIHPDHRASRAVARHLGLAPAREVVDGEVRWRG